MSVIVPDLPKRATGPSALEQRAAQKRAYFAVLAVPCTQHRAKKNEPCFCDPEGICSMRVQSWRRAAVTHADHIARLAQQHVER